MVAQKALGLNLTPMVNGQRYIDTGNYLVNNFIVFLALLLVIYVSGFTYKYIEVKGQGVGRRLINRMSVRDKLPLLKD
jgi:peptidoglycan/LPS O-acetylase OafA/YrhL